MSVLLAALFVASTQETIVLSRGLDIPGFPSIYQGVEDTTLNPQADGPLGGSSFLSGGPGRAILIRFGDLQRVVGVKSSIVGARLELTLATGSRAELSSASVILQPWNEGPSQVVTFGRSPSTSETTWATTHRHRRTGVKPVEWQQPGALGPSDSRILKDARFESSGENRFQLTGIDSVLNESLESPSANSGILLRFSEPVEFYSSESRIGKPRLSFQLGARAKTAASLAVISIHRDGIPAVPSLSEPVIKVQDGQNVRVFNKPTGPVWPNSGQPIRYIATIKNVGNSQTSASGEWAINEVWKHTFQLEKGLAPGESTEVSLSVPFDKAVGDARLHPVMVRVFGDGGRSEMIAYSNGFELRLNVAQGLADAWKQERRWSGISIESFLARTVAHLNDVVLSRSRFASMPSGCTSRVNLASVRIVSDAEWPNKAPNRFEADSKYDSDVWLDSELPISSPEFESIVLKSILKGLGLIDWTENQSAFVFESETSRPGVPGSPYAGLLGGDTRFEGMIPSGIVLPFEPSGNPILDAAQPEAHGQLSLSQASFLLAKLESRDRANIDGWARPPMLTMVRCVDFSGQVLKDIEVKAYARTATGWSNAPILSTKTSVNGNFRIPDRPAEPLRPNPFGYIDADGLNGAILFEIEQFGAKAYSWVTLESIVDAGLRNPGQMALIDLRFDSTDGVVQAANLASGRLVTDSSGLLPARLLSITDGGIKEEATISGESGAWLEIDLGRDRAIGELRIYGQNFWNEFDIVIYGTGQTVNEATRWSGERDFGWMWRNRSKPDSENARYVPYRSSGKLARYIRFVNRRAKPGSAIQEIKIFSVVRPN